VIDPRAADEIIDPARQVPDGVECCVDRRFIGDIDAVKAPSRCMRRFQVEHMHGGAFIVQPARDRAANSATAAGDDGNTALVFLCFSHAIYFALSRREGVSDRDVLSAVELAEKVFPIFVGAVRHQARGK